MKSIELKDLQGKHVLDAVDFGKIPNTVEYALDPDSCAVSFRLDGVVYTATEDPSDGYRSRLRDIFVDDTPMTNVFPGVPVIGRLQEAGSYNSEAIDFIHANTGKVILSVGTDNADDYYPCFVAFFAPENIGEIDSLDKSRMLKARNVKRSHGKTTYKLCNLFHRPTSNRRKEKTK